MDKDIEELLPFYALGALTDEERKLVEAYLREHPEARHQIEEMDETVSVLPHSVAPVEPTRRTKEALMARVRTDERAHTPVTKLASPVRAIRLEHIFQALSLGAALVAIIWALVLNTRLSQLQDQISLLGEALVAQSNSLEEINARLPLLPASAAETISLAGTELRPQARGQLIADPNKSSAVLVIAGLDQLEPGKTYQVWLIDGNGPRSAGLLSVDSNGQGILIVSSELTIGQFDALGISVEPDGGSQQPTGDIVVLSEL